MWPEALPPFVIIASCIAFTGMAMNFLDRWEHGGKVTLGLVLLYRAVNYEYFWWALIMYRILGV